jgi:hypothetical protein
MNKRFLFPFILGIIAVGGLHSQEIQTSATVDSLSNRGIYQLWLDAGVYPQFPDDGRFVPINNIRIGAGKQFSFYGIYGFLELTKYTFEDDYGQSANVSSNKRSDIAFYGVGSLLQIFYVGIGAHYTHQDNIIVQWINLHENNATVESGPRSYFGFYYLIGLGYPIKIFDGISLPIGLYYRRAREYNYDYTPMFDYNNRSLGLQIGIIYNYGE